MHMHELPIYDELTYMKESDYLSGFTFKLKFNFFIPSQTTYYIYEIVLLEWEMMYFTNAVDLTDLKKREKIFLTVRKELTSYCTRFGVCEVFMKERRRIHLFKLIIFSNLS